MARKCTSCGEIYYCTKPKYEGKLSTGCITYSICPECGHRNNHDIMRRKAGHIVSVEPLEAPFI